jgi:subtilisin family serine protease
MYKDQTHPAAETLNLVADPWAFWLILQSRFSGCPQPTTGPTTGSQAGSARSQISFLAQRKADQPCWPDDSTLTEAVKPLGLKVKLAPFYKNSKMFATGSISWDADSRAAAHGSPDELLEKQVTALNLLKKEFHRLKISRPIRPQLREALAAIRTAQNNDQVGERERRDGSGVVVGFVDNGCAFAHPNFIKKEGGVYKSRVMRIWDQSCLWEDSEKYKKKAEKWKSVDDFGYGLELRVDEYNLRTGQPFNSLNTKNDKELTEDQLYAELNHELLENVVMDGMFGPADFTHGTHIMDIAVGANGVAPEAEIVFVQLPQSAIMENTDQASARHILDGVAYVFKYAAEVNKPAVVNISYNAYTGPHDGTSLVELGLDELLKTPGRAVVISAGNARDVNCHEFRTVPAEQCLDGKDGRQPLFWFVNPDDPTENFMEIWYDGGHDLQISVISPDGELVANAVGPNQYSYLKQGCSIMGAVIHRENDLGNGKNQVLIALNPTARTSVRESDGLQKAWSPAASGIWRVEVCNPTDTAVSFHAWIERDDRGENPMVRQSHFLTSRLAVAGEEKDGEEFRKATTEEMHTLGGFCTGKKTIVVGAYNLATGRAMPYSSLGPTVDERPKPDIYAPGASDPAGEGIEAASARSANLVRMTGTSVAAPFVAGLIALEFSDEKSDWRTLDSEQIVERLQQEKNRIESPDGKKDGPYAIRI